MRQTFWREVAEPSATTQGSARTKGTSLPKQAQGNRTFRRCAQHVPWSRCFQHSKGTLNLSERCSTVYRPCWWDDCLSQMEPPTQGFVREAPPPQGGPRPPRRCGRSPPADQRSAYDSDAKAEAPLCVREAPRPHGGERLSHGASCFC